MTEPKQTWENLVAQHRAAFKMSDEHAAAVWDRIVRAHPEAEQLVLVHSVPATARASGRLHGDG